jgi:hypothetical protein
MPVLQLRSSQTDSLRYAFFAEILGNDGTWRSLVARTLGVGEAPSSNLGVPTSLEGFQQNRWKPFYVSFTIVRSEFFAGDLRVLPRKNNAAPTVKKSAVVIA